MKTSQERQDAFRKFTKLAASRRKVCVHGHPAHSTTEGGSCIGDLAQEMVDKGEVTLEQVGKYIVAKPAAEPKTPKDTSTKTASKPAKGGVIATVVGMLLKGKPVTKKQIMQRLVKDFPDRTPESMQHTLNLQLPTRLNREKGLNIKRGDGKTFYMTEKDIARVKAQQ